ncbi:hypothetical protein L484_007555 [Morus notabilis]|uniref:Uncharacterized protein n=1 Tax=Morus notabilis TaxID=981085 RepID=W9SZ76_9ROSA|nr:hypothetical protein L484_007555 [Morus notabilis]
MPILSRTKVIMVRLGLNFNTVINGEDVVNREIITLDGICQIDARNDSETNKGKWKGHIWRIEKNSRIRVARGNLRTRRSSPEKIPSSGSIDSPIKDWQFPGRTKVRRYLGFDMRGDGFRKKNQNQT